MSVQKIQKSIDTAAMTRKSPIQEDRIVTKYCAAVFERFMSGDLKENLKAAEEMKSNEFVRNRVFGLLINDTTSTTSEKIKKLEIVIKESGSNNLLKTSAQKLKAEYQETIDREQVFAGLQESYFEREARAALSSTSASSDSLSAGKEEEELSPQVVTASTNQTPEHVDALPVQNTVTPPAAAPSNKVETEKKKQELPLGTLVESARKKPKHNENRQAQIKPLGSKGPYEFAQRKDRSTPLSTLPRMSPIAEDRIPAPVVQVEAPKTTPTTTPAVKTKPPKPEEQPVQRSLQEEREYYADAGMNFDAYL